MNKRIPFQSLVLLLLFSTLSHATTVERLTLDGLVKKAHRIVVGTVRAARSHYSGDGRLILTTYTLDVQETMKGSGPRITELTTIGGQIGDLQLHVAGMPAFDRGENAIVFIENVGAVSTVVGLSQGKFSIANGEVSNAVGDLSFPDGRPGRPLRLPLESFKRQIRTLVGR